MKELSLLHLHALLDSLQWSIEGDSKAPDIEDEILLGFHELTERSDICQEDLCGVYKRFSKLMPKYFGQLFGPLLDPNLKYFPNSNVSIYSD